MSRSTAWNRSVRDSTEKIEEEIGGNDGVGQEYLASDAKQCDGSFQPFQRNSGTVGQG
ncbi:unnamed protein product [Brassica oleracea]